MKTQLSQLVEYEMRIGEQTLPLNDWLNKPIQLGITGNIYCIQCGRKTAKSFQQGHCFPCMRRLKECNLCIIHPERCQVETGMCPENDWAHAQCNQSHIVYLANSSNLKVGITRTTQQPTRWIDQGAYQALPIFTTQNRYQAGRVEVLLKQYVNDKTNWRMMLKQMPPPIDLVEEKHRILQLVNQELTELLNHYQTQIAPIANDKIITIHYPVNEYPQKITNLSFDKTPQISGVLQGIKGQYLLLDTGVINVRKFSGYEVEVSF